jgi:hypothetical protein
MKMKIRATGLVSVLLHRKVREKAPWFDRLRSDESTTGPENEDTGSSDGLTIAYATDDDAAVTGDITSGSGGTLETTASDGVIYKLVVPPDAVSSTVTATMTPLASLAITDAGASGGSAPAAAPAASVCHKGVVLEPSGVEFEPPAVLTMTFPGGSSGCDLETDYRVVYFESSWNTYEILSTTLDDGANELTCDITHFSVFGTDNPTRDRLRALIEAATATGLAEPDEEALANLASYLEEAEARSWDDLAALAKSGLHDVLDKLADEGIAEANTEPSEDAFDVLFDLLGWAFDNDFDDIDAKLRQGIEAVVRGVAAKGHQECSRGNKEQGIELLILALDWIGDGWVDDPALEDDVEEWLAYCGELTMTLTASRTWITDIALDMNSTATFADFETTVYSYGGEPLEGLSVGLEMVSADGGSARTVDTGYSDASGKVRFRYAYGRSPQANSTLEGKYIFFVGREGRRLAEVEVHLIRVPIGVLFNYGYTHDIEVPNVMYRHTSAHFELGGTRTTQVQDCYWDRAYSLNAWDGYSTTEAVLLPSDYTDCIYDVKTVTYIRDDEYRTPVAVLSGIEVSLRSPALGWVRTTVTHPDKTETTEANVDLRGVFGAAYPPGNSVTLEYFDGTGMFDEFEFSGDTADGNGSGGCTIYAWVLPVWPPAD